MAVSSNKTVVVAVERIKTYPLYGKKIKRMRKYHLHDEVGARRGDWVEFVPCRPISKTKKWRVSQVLSREEK